MIYLELFLTFFKIGLFSFGGGYASLALISDEIVQNKAWLSRESFSDLVSISQMTPGPIAINAATFVGNQVAGIPGAICTTLGNVAPCIIISLLLARLYKKYNDLPMVKSLLKGLQPAVIALIASAAFTLTQEALLSNSSGLANLGHVNLFAIVLFIFSFFAYEKWKKLDPVLIMLIMGAIGGVGYYVVGF